jgi:cell division protein FtsL
MVILLVSIQYLQLKADITSSMKHVASLESQLSQLKEENDAYYSQVTSSIDMTEIRKIATGRLGMQYPGEDQTETYQTARSSYVRQYQDIPESK